MDEYRRLEDRLEWICACMEVCSASPRMRRVRHRLGREYRQVMSLLNEYRVSDTSPVIISDVELENVNVVGNEYTIDIQLDNPEAEPEIIVSNDEEEDDDDVPAPPNTPVSQATSSSRGLRVSTRSRVSFKRSAAPR